MRSAWEQGGVPLGPHLMLSPLLPHAQVEQLELFQREQTKQVIPEVLEQMLAA